MTWPMRYLLCDALVKAAASRVVPLNIRGGLKVTPGMSVKSGPNRQVFPPGVLPPEAVKSPALVNLPDSFPPAPTPQQVKALAKQPMPYQPSSISKLAPVADWMLPVAGGVAGTAGILGLANSALNSGRGQESAPEMIQTRPLINTGGRR